MLIRSRKGRRDVSVAGTISLADLAKRAEIPYQGYDYALPVPDTAGNDYSLVFDAAVREHLRSRKQIIDYTGDIVQTKDWRVGNTWFFTDQEILDSIEATKNKPVFYSRTRLEGKDGILEENSAAVRKEKRKRFFNNDPLVLKPPVTRIFQEGDVGLQGIPQETNAATMPADVKTLESLDLNFDMSGPRKTLRITTQVNGKVMREVVKQYGFAYLAKDIANPAIERPDAPEDTPALLLQNPQAYWTQIEEQITSYIYKPVSGSMELEAEDTVTKEKFLVKYLDETGKGISTSFEKRYLTEKVTSGWRLGRFATEQLEGDLDSRVLDEELKDDTLDPLDRSYFRLKKNSITFRRFPLKSLTSYLLVDPQEYYDKVEETPFQTQKVKASDLGLSGNPGREFIIATPAKDYIYPMMVIAETSQTHSFATMPNPENVYIRDERRAVINDPTLSQTQKEEELKLLKLLPELTTGEDSFTTSRKTIKPSKNTRNRVAKDKKIEEDSFIEYSYGASNQDQNFKNSVQNIKFVESSGRPGSAEPYPDIWVRQSELTRSSKKKDEGTKKKVYYLTSQPLPSGCSTEESISVDSSILSVAVELAGLELTLKNFLSSSEENLNLAWLHSEVKPGDYIVSVDSLTTGLKRVKSVSFSLDYKGFVDGIGKLVTCPGTRVSLGVFDDQTKEGRISLKKEFENSENGLKVSANINIRETILGAAPLLANLRSRRNR